MKYCKFVDGVCPECGRPRPPVEGKVVRECLWQLGNDLERALTAIGITQETWKAAKAKLGLPPNCNCDKRKAWLNKASAQLQVTASKLAQAVRQAYDQPR